MVMHFTPQFDGGCYFYQWEQSTATIKKNTESHVSQN
jgi:hypothetical protein